jgi:hypothetical protein
VPVYSKDDALKEMAEGGVDAAIIHPPASWDPSANELGVEAARQHPDRFAILGNSQPRFDDVSLSHHRRAALHLVPGAVQPRRPREAMAQPGPGGVGLPGGHGLRAFHPQTGKIYSRFVEIVQTLAAGGFFSSPSEADLASADVRPMIDEFVRGRASVSAEERIALFELAWDVTGETFAQRMQQHVRFFSDDPIRLTAGF